MLTLHAFETQIFVRFDERFSTYKLVERKNGTNDLRLAWNISQSRVLCIYQVFMHRSPNLQQDICKILHSLEFPIDYHVNGKEK